LSEGPFYLGGNGWIDPRIPGIWPYPFSELSGLTFEELTDLPKSLQGAEAKVEVKNGEELIQLKWTYKGDNIKREFLLDPKLNFAPLGVSLSALNPDGTVFRDTIDSEWIMESIPSGSQTLRYAFPKTITYKRYDSGEIKRHEICRFTLPKQLNMPIDETIFDWPAMGLRAGTTVRRSGKSNDREHVTWNGKAFEAWKPVLLEIQNLPSSNGPLKPEVPPRRTLFWVNIAMLLACSAYYLLRRFRWRNTSRN